MPFCRTARQMSKPLPPGSMTSSRMTSNCPLVARARPECASVALSTSKPSAASRSVRGHHEAGLVFDEKQFAGH
jgi:hypothetical protein